MKTISDHPLLVGALLQRDQKHQVKRFRRRHLIDQVVRYVVMAAVLAVSAALISFVTVYFLACLLR